MKRIFEEVEAGSINIPISIIESQVLKDETDSVHRDFQTQLSQRISTSQLKKVNNNLNFRMVTSAVSHNRGYVEIKNLKKKLGNEMAIRKIASGGSCNDVSKLQESQTNRQLHEDEFDPNQNYAFSQRNNNSALVKSNQSLNHANTIGEGAKSAGKKKSTSIINEADFLNRLTWMQLNPDQEKLFSGLIEITNTLGKMFKCKNLETIIFDPEICNEIYKKYREGDPYYIKKFFGGQCAYLFKYAMKGESTELSEMTQELK